MSNEEARRIVQSGLDRRRKERNEAAKEQRLEAYERQMIRHCNEHCADEKAIRKLVEAARLKRELLTQEEVMRITGYKTRDRIRKYFPVINGRINKATLAMCLCVSTCK